MAHNSMAWFERVRWVGWMDDQTGEDRATTHLSQVQLLDCGNILSVIRLVCCVWWGFRCLWITAEDLAKYN